MEILVVKIEMVPLLLLCFDIKFRNLVAYLTSIPTSVVDQPAALVQSPRLKTILQRQTGSQIVTEGSLEFLQQKSG